MLYAFVVAYRDAIIERAREKVTARSPAPPAANELEHRIPFLLTQLAETLCAEESGPTSPPGAIDDADTRHGCDLLALGFTMSQVVHDYGDICQAVTELAMDQNAPITMEEFLTLDRCLDLVIAKAVTARARVTLACRSTDESGAGHLAHDIQAMVETATLAFEVLKDGAVAISGSTGAVLGRSLISLEILVERALTDIRLKADGQRRDVAPSALVPPVFPQSST